MLDAFDWLRRSENGAELIATIGALKPGAGLFLDEPKMGLPVHGIDGPCKRCWIFPRLPGLSYCEVCHTIQTESRRLGSISRECLLIWGHVNFLPDSVKGVDDQNKTDVLAIFVQDENHFLTVIRGHGLNGWLREIILHHGSDLKGLFTIFPTTGKKQTFTMGDILCRVIHHDSRFPMDQLRIRFFSKPGQLKAPHLRENEGILTFEAAVFLGILEMAVAFRSRLNTKELEMVRGMIGLKDNNERAFYWGRMIGVLSIETRNMLSDWNFRQWPENKMKLLCDLAAYARPAA